MTVSITIKAVQYMGPEQKRKILQRIASVETDIEAVRQARSEIASTGYASATIASAGGSKSYTRFDLEKLTDMLSELTYELKSLRALLAGRSPWQPLTVRTVYS